MKIQIGSEIVKSLAQDMESGFDVFVNIKTGETKTLLNIKNFTGVVNEFWEKEFDAINKNREDFIKIEPPASHESYDFMGSFVPKVQNSILRYELEEALDKRRSIARLNELIDNSEYREEWFSHKTMCFYNYLAVRLEYNDIGIEEYS